MILKKLVLRNFRNYSEQEIIFNDKFNFIYGDNGHGKTNILEAISYTTFGKSFLGSSEADCISFGSSEFFIEAEFENDIGNHDRIVINCNLDNRSKSIHMNKQKVGAFSSEVFGRFPIVFLSPKSINITYGNPSDRRRFFDILISQSSRLYLEYLKELSRLLKQKNALLKNYTVFKKYTPAEFNNLLNSYNEKLIDISAQIIFKRLNFLIEYDSFFERSFSMLIVKDNRGFISYQSDALGEINPKEARFELDYIKQKTSVHMLSSVDEEISRALTLTGPQRDDYLFKLQKADLSDKRTFDLKNFASQGEHKTFLVALKLSEYDYLKDKKSTSPVLLLDDVLSELDESRVSKIISHLKDYGQIFLTTTDRTYLEHLKQFYSNEEISEFEIEQGKIIN